MKFKAIFLVLILTWSGCKTPAYLPASDQIDVNAYGAYIHVNPKSKVPALKGELIAIDQKELVVLTDDGKSTVLPLAEVTRFKVLYAKPKHYGASIPAALTLPFLNGFFSVFTFPLHLIVTTSVTVTGENAYTYNQKNMTYENLKMFARFPQGIPDNVNLQELKPQETK